MSKRPWMYVGTGLLLLLFWFSVSPQTFLRNPLRGDPDTVSLGDIPSLPQTLAIRVQTNRQASQTAVPEVDAALETGSGKEVPGEKLVRFTSKEACKRFMADAPPGSVLGYLDEFNVVRVKSGGWLENAARQNGGTVSGNYYVRVPQVPLEVRQQGEAMYRVVGKKALDLMGADGVTDSWGRGVRVALMDTSLDSLSMGSGENAGHGVAMRSLIQGNAGPARGAAPGSILIDFPVLGKDGTGNSFDLAQAILQATDQGARVINMSLGSDGDSPVVRDAVQYALARDVVLVAAAGNEAVNRVSYPAAYEGVVAVASVDADGNHLYFSNRGKPVDVAAPGFAVVAAWPGGKNVEVSGTSASTALVSGAIAALLAKEPGLTGAQAARLISEYADDTGTPGRDEETGGGVMNLQRVMERNQRGIVDVAVAGVTLKEEGSLGRITAAMQNRGTETVNSPSLEITAGSERRKFYFGSLAPGQTVSQSMTLDLTRARQDGGLSAGAAVEVRGDQQNSNDLWTGYFRISKEK